MRMSRRLAAIAILFLTISCQRAEPMAGGQPLSHWTKEAKQVVRPSAD
jgi:hypothetical protein